MVSSPESLPWVASMRSTRVLVKVWSSPEPRRRVSAELVEDGYHVIGRPLLDNLPIREAIDVDGVPA
jgi:hypothetical protein